MLFSLFYIYLIHSFFVCVLYHLHCCMKLHRIPSNNPGLVLDFSIARIGRQIQKKYYFRKVHGAAEIKWPTFIKNINSALPRPAFDTFCAHVLSLKEVAERERELDPDSHLTRRGPGRRRRAAYVGRMPPCRGLVEQWIGGFIAHA